MSRRQKYLVIGCFIALLVGSGCSKKDPDKQAIANLAEHFASCVENGDKEGFKRGLHPDYRDRFGHDRNTLVDRVFLIVSKMSALDVEIVGLTFEEIDRDYGSARFFFKVKLHGEGKPRGYAWEEIRKRNVVIQARRMDGYWYAIKTDLGIDLLGALF